MDTPSPTPPSESLAPARLRLAGTSVMCDDHSGLLLLRGWRPSSGQEWRASRTVFADGVHGWFYGGAATVKGVGVHTDPDNR